MRRFALLLGILVLIVPATAQADPRAVEDPSAQPDVEPVTIRREVGSAVLLRSWYTSWNGRVRTLLIAYPRSAPATGAPLLVTNHPAGMSMICTDEVALAAVRAGYALACLSGQGVVTRAFSYGSAGQIADLARAPQLVESRIPDIRLDTTRHCDIPRRTTAWRRSTRSPTSPAATDRSRLAAGHCSRPSAVARR